MATLAQPAGPFVLGTFALPDGEPFPGLLARGRVLDLTTALTWAPSGVRAVVERWEEALPVLHTLADEPALDWRPLEGLWVHAPLEPRQIFQSGANYRQHVIDLEVAHRSPDDPRTVEEAREEIAAVMDRRAAEDLPYVFIGLPSAITGPYDDVVLPSWAEQPDWELELAAVIARPAYQVTVEEALEYVAGYTIANDLTDRATVFRRDMPAIGTDWLRCKNAPASPRWARGSYRPSRSPTRVICGSRSSSTARPCRTSPPRTCCSALHAWCRTSPGPPNSCPVTWC